MCVVPALFQTERQKSDLLQAKMSLLSDELEDTTARMQEYQAEVRSCIDWLISDECIIGDMTPCLRAAATSLRH